MSCKVSRDFVCYRNASVKLLPQSFDRFAIALYVIHQLVLNFLSSYVSLVNRTQICCYPHSQSSLGLSY